MTALLRQELLTLLPRLRRFALALTGNPSDADDLVQVGCEKALKAAAQWHPGTRADSWLFKIMQNHWIDQLRARTLRGHAVDPEVLENIADDRWNRQMEARQTLDRVLAVMSLLPETTRAVMALVTIEGQSYQEAADTLGLPIGTVMSRLARGRLELVRRLEGSQHV